MNFDSVLQWLTFLGVIGLGLYFRSYLSRKAENLATKEDVSEITKQVESMKAHSFISIKSVTKMNLTS